MSEKETLLRPSIASPDGALSFLFGIFGLLMWFVSVWEPSDGVLFSAGLIWIILSFGALAASLLNLIRGKPKGNINLLATLLLGFFPGINALTTLGARLSHTVYDPGIAGWMYVIGSIFCCGVLFKRAGKPVYRIAVTAMVALGMFFEGISDISGSRLFQQLGGWCLFLFALLMFYYGLSVMYQYFGRHLPQGPVLARHTVMEGSLSVSRSGRSHSIYSPSMIVSFISAVFGTLNVLSAWTSPHLDGLIVMAVMRLMLGNIYFLGAMINLLKGNVRGNIQLIFSVCFGLLSGSNLMFSLFKDTWQISMQTTLYGILQIFTAAYLALLLPVMKDTPIYQWTANFCASAGLFCFGFREVFRMSIFGSLAGLFFLVFTVFSLYAGLSTVVPDLPQGPYFSRARH